MSEPVRHEYEPALPSWPQEYSGLCSYRIPGAGACMRSESAHVEASPAAGPGSPLDACAICGDPVDHNGKPHSEATGDGRTRADVTSAAGERRPDWRCHNPAHDHNLAHGRECLAPAAGERHEYRWSPLHDGCRVCSLAADAAVHRLAQNPDTPTPAAEPCTRREGHIGWLNCPTHNARVMAALDRIFTPPTPTPAADGRCPSCEHSWSYHTAPGCWFTVVSGRPGKDCVCACSHPRSRCCGRGMFGEDHDCEKQDAAGDTPTVTDADECPASMADLVCCCGHAGQLHVPGGGSCTAGFGGCDCRSFVRRTRLADEVPGLDPLPDDSAGGVNAATQFSPAMDGHDDPGAGSFDPPARGPSPSSAAGGHRIEHTVLVYLELNEERNGWEVAQSTVDGHPLDSPDGQPTRGACACEDAAACGAVLAAAYEIPNPTGEQLAVMIRDTWHPRYDEEAGDG